jgi:thiol-disulfide isomerase/thioredoxin
MKMIPKLLMIMLSGLLLAQDAEKKDLEVGDEAPTWALMYAPGKFEFLRNWSEVKIDPKTGKEKKLRLNVSQPDRHAVVMSFFATWCKPCMKELPILEEVYQQYKDERVKFFLIDITEATRSNPGTVYGMSYKDVPVAGPFLKKKGVTMQILFDNRGTAMKRYYAQTLPRLFMVDGYRNVTFKKRGFPDGEGADEKFKKDISSEIDRLLSELPPSKK